MNALSSEPTKFGTQSVVDNHKRALATKRLMLTFSIAYFVGMAVVLIGMIGLTVNYPFGQKEAPALSVFPVTMYVGTFLVFGGYVMREVTSRHLSK